MHIDDSIVQAYLRDEPADRYRDHWLFYAIQEGRHLFDPPPARLREAIAATLADLSALLSRFQPWNADMVHALWPHFPAVQEEAHILLSVGCPEPYDAMVRRHHDQEYIIFDLVRFHGYAEKGHDLRQLISKLLTHELVHLCIHQDYPPPQQDYHRLLDYLVFDEGFAHCMAYQPQNHYGVLSAELRHYQAESLVALAKAVSETDPDRQEQLLEEADSGPYWQKFGAIAGKLYLLSQTDDFAAIYRQGWQGFCTEVLNHRPPS